MPDWRAFGQPVTDHPATPAHPAPRPTPLALLTQLPRGTRIALAVALLVAVAGIGLAVLTPSGGEVALDDGMDVGALPAAAAGTLIDGPAMGAIPTTGPLVIDVAGAVARPGLIRLPAGSRIGDAVAAAGGYAPTADLDAAARDLNLAAPLADGAKVLVPALGASAVAGAGDTSGGDGGTSTGLLDLNAADQAGLEALPGIGPVTAGRILEARAEAPFASVDELRGRGLVGESTFARLRDLVTVRP